MSKNRLVSGFHHFAMEVSDMDKSIAFYRDILGFKLSERHTADEIEAIPMDLTFLRVGENHHDLVLAHNPNKKYRARNEADAAEGPAYIHHFAFGCPDKEAWLEIMEDVKARGIEIVRGPVVHSKYNPRGDGSWGENESFYVLDPDGHRLELFCEMATIAADGTFVSAAGERIEEAKVEEV
ncbi:MAG: VOC family protein [Rhodospirillaceae bacterium]|jgi:catechol 2,3-dioxygenase|nr:VOC family protein [Rhodospirillaceae bacterium]MBT3885448.1 VOC family protein [Rhodospirillaceae bacterium]MBT4115798.1 VOC family protein [Rhodospirillaceae bacterium]MBT4718576.1 VOC family protein [Rhodospirillaceae bacterium]MBT4749676.1 VOC family protein [Rhodospirillaceae bacterium]